MVGGLGLGVYFMFNKHIKNLKKSGSITIIKPKRPLLKIDIQYAKIIVSPEPEETIFDYFRMTIKGEDDKPETIFANLYKNVTEYGLPRKGCFEVEKTDENFVIIKEK